MLKGDGVIVAASVVVKGALPKLENSIDVAVVVVVAGRACYSFQVLKVVQGVVGVNTFDRICLLLLLSFHIVIVLKLKQ